MAGDGTRPGSSSRERTQISPQGVIGDLLSRIAAPMGRPLAGSLDADPAGGPFDIAGPPPGAPSTPALPDGLPMAPQGIVGDLLSRLGPAVGAPVGGSLRALPAGGETRSRPASPDAPPPRAAEASPMAPQGIVGDLLSRLAQVVGAPVGGALPRGRADAP